MDYILSLIFVFFLNQAIGQNKVIDIVPSSVVIGKQYVTGEEINAIHYGFPDRIHNYYVDTLTSYMTVQLRGLSKNGKWLNNRGDVILYDLKEKRVKWSDKIIYEVEGLGQVGSVLIHSSPKRSNYLNIETGDPIWEVKNSLYHINPKNMIGLGYKVKSSQPTKHKLEGIDLRTGQVIWTRDVDNEYGWNETHYLNDSTLILVAAGIHLLELHTGSGWSFKAITGKRDYKGTVAANALGVAAGLLTGTFIGSTGHNTVRELVSNVIVESEKIYFADRENVTCLDLKGKLIWSTAFREDQGSKSTILIIDGKLLVINFGYAFMGDRKLDFGKAFVTSYDLANGNELMEINPGTEDSGPISGISFKNKSINILLGSRVETYSIETGEKLVQRDLKTTATHGNPLNFLSDRVYANVNDTTYACVNLLDTGSINIYTDKGVVLQLDVDLEIKGQIDSKNLWIYYQQHENVQFLAQGNESLLLNEERNILAELRVSSKSRIIGSKLYDVQENGFLEIDLNELMN